jgi:hypothetical protein
LTDIAGGTSRITFRDMTPERWQQVEHVYHLVVARPAGERLAAVAELCGSDQALRTEVESLLAQELAASAFLENPPFAGAVAAAGAGVEAAYVGRRFGSYRVLALLGAGGMGEVYRAHDEKLGRDVAIKVVPPVFSSDSRRRERFEREARMLAALNHPAIGAIYGHADVDGDFALVLELVDGETLAERMVRPVSVAEALAIARSIAEALEAAHERGIVHRDLKPANIKITPDGLVKVLDFGLARIAAGESGEAIGSSASPASPATTDGHDTRVGTIVGTAAYMSPEQAAGKTADKRSDLWSFGVILLEMLTGRPVFTGVTDSDILAAVQGTEPPLARLPAGTPAAIRTLLRRCLEKDRKRRLDSATAARLEIEDVVRGPEADVRVPAASRGRVARIAAATVVGLALGAALGAAITMRLRPDTPVAVSRFAIVTPPSMPMNVASEYRDLALSRDGRFLVYRAAGTTTNGSELHVRALDEVDARPLAGIGYAYAPFFSPDGRWVGFFENGELKKVSIAGGPVITVGPVIGAALGASWGDDNMIVFATDDPATGLWRISADGGEPELLTTPDGAQQERDHGFPSLLPGGRGVLFTILAAETSLAQVAVLDLDTRRRTILVRGGGHGEYVDRRSSRGTAGHLVYAASGILRAIRFDPRALTVAGDPVEMVPRVMMKSSGAANYAVSAPGTLGADERKRSPRRPGPTARRASLQTAGRSRSASPSAATSTSGSWIWLRKPSGG